MPPQPDTRSLGRVFDEVAEDYDRHRPTYPDMLVERACEGIGPGAAVLEIGCGTGQLTRSLLGRGLRVTAVEPGQRLIVRARDQLNGVGDVQFVNARLEDASLPRAQYSTVFSASAIHWIDPDVSWRRAADALVDGGSLALVSYFGLDDPRSADDQQALRAAMTTVAPEFAADWPTTATSPAPSPALRPGARTSRRCGRGWGAMRSRAGMRQTCSMTRRSSQCRRSWSTPLTSSTLCSAPCRSGQGCHPYSGTLSSPRTKPSTSG
jgi:SAM-dependent methyltransferase